ncbi:alpha/beta hydrolase fold family protein [Mycobacterium xenopi 3993]|nr:alpha/beta hydrolase fold family protein [Mycobacterium xenopi 3993]
MGGKRHQAYPLMSHLVELGWVCVAINYRLSPRSTWPDHIVDVKRALAWTKTHIAEYGGDPDWIAITGGSAGGHLSALAALTANNPSSNRVSKTLTPACGRQCRSMGSTTSPARTSRSTPRWRPCWASTCSS